MPKLKPRKIALVYDCIYPFVKGGGERRFYEMGIRLVKMGYEVHWYGMKFWEGGSIREHDGIVLHGLCKAKPIYTKSGRRSISQALIFGLSVFKLFGEDFDIIDCCGFPYFSIFSAKLVVLIKRRPLFATWHEVWGKAYWREYLGAAGLIGYWVEKVASKLPDHIIVPSEHTAMQLKEYFNVEDSQVIANGIDTLSIKSLQPSPISTDIIYVGRLMEFKNVDMIIEAIKLLKTSGQELYFTIVGDGPERTKLQKLAKKLKVDSQITWLGFLEKNNEVYACMKAAKVFVLASEREGFGIVALESNACGTPVLTANFPANATKELVHENVNGYLFEPSVAELVVVLKRVLQNVTKLESSTLKFSESFDWNKLTKQLAEAYNQ